MRFLTSWDFLTLIHLSLIFFHMKESKLCKESRKLTLYNLLKIIWYLSQQNFRWQNMNLNLTYLWKTTCKLKKGCNFKDTIYPGIFNKPYVIFYDKLLLYTSIRMTWVLDILRLFDSKISSSLDKRGDFF